MTHKTPKTIADLKINWTFSERFNNIELFRQINPSICNLKLKPNAYWFWFEKQQFCCHSFGYESLATFFSFMNICVLYQFHKSIKLNKFERISDTEYILHGKKVD